MKLFEVSYGVYTYYAIAKDENAAVKKVQKKHNLHHLAFTAKEIDLEGYELVKEVI